MDTAPVVVGIDTSETARAALLWARAYARKFNLPLEAVMAWEKASYHGYPTVPIDHGAEERARTALEENVRETLGDDADVTQRLMRGKPAPVLLKAAESASLLVVGTRGHGAFAGMLLGSVSQHCVQHAPCPVVVIPPK